MHLYYVVSDRCQSALHWQFEIRRSLKTIKFDAGNKQANADHFFPNVLKKSQHWQVYSFKGINKKSAKNKP